MSNKSTGTVQNCSLAFSLIAMGNEAEELDACSWYACGAWSYVPTWSGVKLWLYVRHTELMANSCSSAKKSKIT